MNARIGLRLETSHDGLAARRGVALALGMGPIPYEVYGAAHGPVVVVLGNITASRHVVQNELDETPGWWEKVVGPGRAIDTNRYCVVGIDYLTSLRASISPRTLTTFDQACGVELVLDAIKVRKVRAIVGAPYGGMVALAFAARTPERLERTVVISAAHRNDRAATVPGDSSALSVSVNLHGVIPEGIKVPTTLIGVVEDDLVPIELIRQLHRRLGGPSLLIEVNSHSGHETFLDDADSMIPFIADALTGPSLLSLAGRNDTVAVGVE